MNACAVSVPLLCCSAPRAVRIIAVGAVGQGPHGLPAAGRDRHAGDPLDPVRPVRRDRRPAPPRSPWCAAATYASSTRPSRIAMCSSPLASARSVPGSGCRCSAGAVGGGGAPRVDDDVPGAGGPALRRSTAWPAAWCRPGWRRPAGSRRRRRCRPAGTAARGRRRTPGCRRSPPTTCRTGRCSRSCRGPQRDPGELAERVGLLVGQPAAAEAADARPARSACLGALDPGGDRGRAPRPRWPGAAGWCGRRGRRGPAGSSSRSRVVEQVGRGPALGAQAAAVGREVRLRLQGRRAGRRRSS